MLTPRQEQILEFIALHGPAQGQEIKKSLEASQATLNRELKVLVDLFWIERMGAGRSTAYKVSQKYQYLFPIDLKKYYQKGVEERKIRESFNFEIFNDLSNIKCFNQDEIKQLEVSQKKYEKKIKTISSTLLQKEWERFTIELSWKSAEIEGNTYDLLETEALFKYQKKAVGKPELDATMLLNHKEALDFIFQNRADFSSINIILIENLHRILIKNLNVSFNIRNRLIGITGTKYRPLDNPYQIREGLESLCLAVNKKDNFFEKALLLVIGISYLQPFEDGNKRTSRLLANAILMSGNHCPLSYRSIDQIDYKKALLLFYEQNNIEPFKNIFIEQYEFAVENYF